MHYLNLGRLSCALIVVMALASVASAVSGTWDTTVSGNWSDTANWLGGTVPQNAGDAANFPASNLTSGALVYTVDTNITVTSIDFGPGFSNTPNQRHQINASGGSILTLDANGGTASITGGDRRNSGQNPVITAPIEINGPLLLAPTGAFAAFIFTGDISGTVGDPEVNITITDEVTMQNNTVSLGGGEIVVQDGSLTAVDTTAGNSVSGTLGGAGGLIRFTNTSNLVLRADKTTNFDADLVFEGSSHIITLTKYSTLNSGAHRVGSVTLAAGTTVTANAQGGYGYNLYINPGEIMTLNPGSTFHFNSGGTFDPADLIIASGARLTGTGTVTTSESSDRARVLVVTGGTLAPGQSTGILNVGDLSNLGTQLQLNAGANLNMEIQGTTPGTGHDQINLIGEVTLTDAILNTFVNLSAGDLPDASTLMYLLLNDDIDPVVGTFDGLPEGTRFSLGTYKGLDVMATISYLGDSNTDVIGAGNDIVLYDFYIPEPAGLSLLGLGAIALLRRRKPA